MRWKEHLKTIFLILGIVVFLILCSQVRWGELAGIFQGFHWWYLAILLGYTFIWRFLHALAFYILCSLKGTKLGSYVVTQIFSNTISDLFFVGNMGGEVYRAAKMTSYYPQYQKNFWGMTVMYNVYYAFAMMFVFLSSGLYLSFVWSIPKSLKIIFLVMIGLFLIFTVCFFYLQSRGLLSQCVGLIGKFPFAWAKRFSRFLLKKTLPIDRLTKNLHKKEPGRVFFFIFLMYLSRMLTIGEALLIGLAMGLPIGFSEAVLINIVDSFVRIAFFLVPNGQLGVIEAAMVSLGGVVGQSATAMFGFALVQRIRILFWDGIGLTLMMWEKKYGSFYGKPPLDA